MEKTERKKERACLIVYFHLMYEGKGKQRWESRNKDQPILDWSVRQEQGTEEETSGHELALG